jgi:hypothetical protein
MSQERTGLLLGRHHFQRRIQFDARTIGNVAQLQTIDRRLQEVVAGGRFEVLRAEAALAIGTGSVPRDFHARRSDKSNFGSLNRKRCGRTSGQSADGSDSAGRTHSRRQHSGRHSSEAWRGNRIAGHTHTGHTHARHTRSGHTPSGHTHAGSGTCASGALSADRHDRIRTVFHVAALLNQIERHTLRQHGACGVGAIGRLEVVRRGHLDRFAPCALHGGHGGLVGRSPVDAVGSAFVPILAHVRAAQRRGGSQPQ